MKKEEFLDIVVHHLDFVLDGSVNLVIRADGVYAVCDDGTYKITRKAKAAAWTKAPQVNTSTRVAHLHTKSPIEQERFVQVRPCEAERSITAVMRK